MAVSKKAVQQTLALLARKGNNPSAYKITQLRQIRYQFPRELGHIKLAGKGRTKQAILYDITHSLPRFQYMAHSSSPENKDPQSQFQNNSNQHKESPAESISSSEQKIESATQSTSQNNVQNDSKTTNSEPFSFENTLVEWLRKVENKFYKGDQRIE